MGNSNLEVAPWKVCFLSQKFLHSIQSVQFLWPVINSQSEMIISSVQKSKNEKKAIEHTCISYDRKIQDFT